MRCLVTGGAGFLGSHMIDRLIREGHRVYAVDTEPVAGCVYARADIRQAPLDLDNLQFDWIFHFAGLAAIPPSMERPADYFAVNTQGTANVLEAARKAGASRFIYAASGTCYGFSPPQPTNENQPIHCETPYALSKWLGEEMVFHYDHVFDLPSVSLRLFSPIGPRMAPDTSALGYFMKLRAEGKPLTVTGDGSQYRDMHDVADCAEAFYLAARSDIRDEAINIGSGEPVTIKRLAELLGGPIEYLPARREAKGTHADISKAKRLLSWEPTIPLVESIKRMTA